jgi:hypothetical protein
MMENELENIFASKNRKLWGVTLGCSPRMNVPDHPIEMIVICESSHDDMLLLDFYYSLVK